MVTVKKPANEVTTGCFLKGIGIVYFVQKLPDDRIRLHVRGTEPVILGPEQDIEVLEQ